MNTNAIKYVGQLAAIGCAALMESFGLEGSLFGDNTVAPQIGVDFVEPIRLSTEIDLQPTNYCTAMWNGERCSGEHTVHNGQTYHTTPFDPTADYYLGGAMWTTGGITRDLRTGYVLQRISDVPAEVCHNVDVKLDRSPS